MRRTSLLVALMVVALTRAAQAQDVQGSPTAALAETLAAGDAAWAREDHAAAFAAYDAVVRADSGFSTRALFRLGTLHAWGERLDAAIACHRLYVRLEPSDLEGRVALGRTLAWAGRYPASIAQYDTVLAREPSYRDAGLGKATTLAWWGRLDAAVREAERWQRLLPSDQEVTLARAQFLSWAGRLDEALALYDSLARAGEGFDGASAREGAKGRARVLAWRGDLDLSELRWRTYLSAHPEDVSAWVGLAQVLRWMGRPFAAREALDRAVALAPDDRDAREQMRWVRAETSPQVATSWVLADDSERNTLLVSEISGALALRGDLRLNASLRSKRVGSPAAAIDAESRSAAAQLQWQPAGSAWSVRGELGVVAFPELSASSEVAARFGARVAGRLGERWRAGVGLTREPLDEVYSSMDAAVSYTGADADLSFAVRPQLSLAVALSGGSATGHAIDTDRATAMAAARWTVSRGLRTALTHREVAWSEPAYGVFFAPQRFAITELSVGWERTRDLGLVASTDVGIGAQGVRFESDPLRRNGAWRAGVRLGWRPMPGREIVVGVVHANVAGVGTITASEYSYSSLTLTARWTF